MREALIVGIYRVRDEAHKVSFIGYSYNIGGIFKRFRFELGLNSCAVKPLQAMYNAADGKVTMEILEQIEVSAQDADSTEILSRALARWQDDLTAGGETVRVILL